MVDTTVLNDVLRLVNEDRQDSYGDPQDNLWRIAGMWSAYLDTEVTAEDVCNMMTMLKISRTRATYKRDNSLDGIAYLLLADMFGRYDGTK